ncbi:MAG: type 1 periplasmic binding fold superfamily protein [Winogradskyella sp.]|uniref:type 1 periplasmic binding fold superfamily protein n=1 Tax=Winogradskyella sp. TaxID=1883156 RepID=UPI0025D1A604|nr:type 1 periplasmic binding fold superfamily protein [Winogradskyella sp.]NRB84518.1 type 1 periplasmic binding fold superfamily protein [Winogradskyella sp.]
MKTTKFLFKTMLCLALVSSFTSCSDDDDPAPVNEEELITNLTLTFTNTTNPGDVVLMSSVAPDGLEDGLSTETIIGSFTPGASYALTIGLLNESESPAEDVLNGDIIPEADEHFFVYAVNGLNLTMTRDASDIDGPDGSKLGVNTTWIAGASSFGNLQIRLIHEPSTVDDSDEFGSATGGSEDFNITFSGVVIN